MASLPLKDGKDALLDLINADSKTVFSWATISVNTPTASSAEPGTNTVVTVTPALGTAYQGTVNLFYNRVLLSRAFAKTDLEFTVPSSTTIHALISQINTSYNTFFTTDDLVDGAVAAATESITLTVASTSYLFIPGSTVTIFNITTVLLMHFDGPNKGTSMVDVFGNVATAVSGAALSTTQSKFGGSSLEIPLSSAAGYVSVADAPNLHLTGAFTIELFHYITVNNKQIALIKKNASSGDMIQINSTQYSIINDGASTLITGGPVPINQWVHIALVCTASGVWTFYVNGTALGTHANGGTFGNNSAVLGIGNWPGQVQGLNNGFIDELRISQIARYTANFTPPSSPFTS